MSELLCYGCRFLHINKHKNTFLFHGFIEQPENPVAKIAPPDSFYYFPEKSYEKAGYIKVDKKTNKMHVNIGHLIEYFCVIFLRVYFNGQTGCNQYKNKCR